MARKPGRGRPPNLTPAVQARLVKDIKAGVPKTTACVRNGVGYSTFKRWVADGRKSGKRYAVYRAFRAAIKKAAADAEAERLRVIREAAVGRVETTLKTTTEPSGAKKVERSRKTTSDWTAAAWFLERVYPEKYGAQRKEIAELRKQLAALEVELARVHGGRTAAAGGAGTPAAGSDPPASPGHSGGPPDAGPAAGGPGCVLPDAGADAGPVAGPVPGGPAPAADAPVLPPVGEDDGGGGPDVGPLFDPA